MSSSVLRILLLASVVFSLNACKKLRELTRFDITTVSYTTIPSGGVINLPFPVFTPDIETNSAQEFESNKTEAKLVRTAFLQSLTLNIHQPNQANFDFLRSLEVYISADNLEEKRIAIQNDIPQTGLKTLEVNVDNSIDLKEYIKAEKYKLRIQAVTRQLPGSDVSIRINSRFEVEATIF